MSLILNGDLTKLKNLGMGMYKDAVDAGKPFKVWLEDYVATKEGGGFETPYRGLSNMETFMEIRRMKAAGETVPMTAYELALAAHDIKAFGSITDPVSKFFTNASTSTLFPEFIGTRIYTGAIVSAIWPFFMQETVNITGLTFKKIYLNDTAPQRQGGRVGRGGLFPKKTFTVGDESVNLEKYGVEIEFDYEILADQPLNLYGKELEKIGKQIGVDETDDMFYILVNGDGNSNGLESAQTVSAVTSGSVSKLDIIDLATACPMPYNLNVFAGPTAYMRLYWDALSDMTNPNLQKAEIPIPLPMGYRWDSGQMLSVTDRFYGVDKSQAISYVTNDAMLLTETDRIINKQVVTTVVSKRGIFTVNTQDAIGCLDITA